MPVTIERLRIRNYKLGFLEHTRTPEGREQVAKFLIREGKFTTEEITEIVNNQLPAKQKPWVPSTQTKG